MSFVERELLPIFDAPRLLHLYVEAKRTYIMEFCDDYKDDACPVLNWHMVNESIPYCNDSDRDYSDNDEEETG